MQLSFDEIRQITCGAVDMTREKNGIRFYRFTREQMELYAIKNRDFYLKALSTAGITLSFKTNSRKLVLKTLIEHTIGRKFFSVDVYVNGSFLGDIKNFVKEELPREYTTLEFSDGEYEGSFDLGEGMKEVAIYLPWNRKLYLKELSLDDGAVWEANKPEKKMLVFGDSITQGYDAVHPYHRYAGQFARALGAEEFNKAIGGECIYPELAATKDDIDPDYILLAYGTNDWSKTSPETFKTNGKAFFANLTENYPKAKVFVLTPIWRSNMLTLKTNFNDFFDIDTMLREFAEPYKNMTVIRGFDFVPHDVSFFSDYGLHPNDEGFDHYFNNLWKTIN